MILTIIYVLPFVVYTLFSSGQFKVQGLFLQRQAEVSKEFSKFMTDNLLTPTKIWNEISNGSKSKNLRTAIINELQKELSFLFDYISIERWVLIAERIASVIPLAAVQSYDYITEVCLDLFLLIRCMTVCIFLYMGLCIAISMCIFLIYYRLYQCYI